MLSYVYIQSEGITRGNLSTQQKEVDEEEGDYRLNHETLKHSLCAIKIMGEYLSLSCAKKSSGRGLRAPFVISEAAKNLPSFS